MEITFTARFVQTGYHVESADGGQTLDQLLASTFARGSVIEITLKAKTTGDKRGFCTAETKYGACATVLDADGTCSQAERHLPRIAEAQDAA